MPTAVAPLPSTATATLKRGKPYIWVTWLCKLLGGQQCQYRVWFQARYRYDKVEEEALDLVEWNRQHNALMAARTRELIREGYTVTTESENSFKLEGATAILAGKPDLIARKDGQVLVIDGKTGRQRESDIWQVLFYLFALQKARKDITGPLEAEVQYAKGDERIAVTPAELTPARVEAFASLIQIVAGPEPPSKVPSRDECKRCNIGSRDCPERVTAAKDPGLTRVEEF